MAAFWFLPFVLGVCGLAWYLVARRGIRAWQVLPAATAVLLVPAAFGFGALYGAIHANLCYASVVESLADAAIDAARSGSAERARAFEAMARSLPLWGYETECGRLRAHLARAR